MLAYLYLLIISFISVSANNKETVFFLSYAELRFNFLLYIKGTEVPKISNVG